MNPPVFSIVTPSYNQGRFLGQTIRSVLSQSFPDVQYFVMDGGSDDDSLSIIRQNAPHLSGWVSEPDRGQADAINKGFQRADGEIFGWINSDDFYLPNAFQTAADFFAAHPDVDLVYGDVLAVDGDGKLMNAMTFGEYSLTDLMTFRIISQPGVFFRRSAWERSGGLSLDYHLLLDHQLWLKMLHEGRMVYLPQPMAAARFHADAKNRAHAAEFGQEARRIAAWLLHDPAYRTFAGKMKRQIQGGAAWLDANYLSNAYLPWQALAAYARAFTLVPGRVLSDWRRVLLTLLMALSPEKAKSVFENQSRKRLASLSVYQSLLEQE